MAESPLWSLAELNELEPDDNHYDSTLDNLWDHRCDEHVPAGRPERAPVAQINPSQLEGEPIAVETLRYIESIQSAIREGMALPHVVVLHDARAEHPYALIEGRHRYNAHFREGAPTIRAFVAHVNRCGRPPRQEPYEDDL
jgi:hypothetical protein